LLRPSEEYWNNLYDSSTMNTWRSLS
jgi:hypothetical protein